MHTAQKNNNNINRKHKNITVDTKFEALKAFPSKTWRTNIVHDKQVILKLTTQLLRSLQSKNGIQEI